MTEMRSFVVFMLMVDVISGLLCLVKSRLQGRYGKE